MLMSDPEREAGMQAAMFLSAFALDYPVFASPRMCRRR